MQPKIHPLYYPNATVTCACGNAFTTGSTKESLRVEICGACHPFYTGKEKFVDTARRVEKFQEKMAKVAKTSDLRRGKKAKVAKKVAERAKAKAEAKKAAAEPAAAGNTMTLSETQ